MSKYVVQAVVTEQDEMKSSSVPLDIAFFNQDGTPFEFPESGGTTVGYTGDVVIGENTMTIIDGIVTDFGPTGG